VVTTRPSSNFFASKWIEQKYTYIRILQLLASKAHLDTPLSTSSSPIHSITGQVTSACQYLSLLSPKVPSLWQDSPVIISRLSAAELFFMLVLKARFKGPNTAVSRPTWVISTIFSRLLLGCVTRTIFNVVSSPRRQRKLFF
jgi:hypothetical protein